MSATPLRVLLAIEDRTLLRHGSRLLIGLGHVVRTAASPEMALHCLQSDRPDVVVVGGGSQDAALALCRATAEPGRPHDIFRLLVVNDPAPAQVVAALEAGVDDFLALPLDAAELLARLRTAARSLEFERRMARVTTELQTAGLLDRALFVERLDTELRSSSRGRKPVACIVLQPDAYVEIRDQCGLPVAQRGMQELLTRVSQVGPVLGTAQWDSARVAIALLASLEELQALAEHLRSSVDAAGLMFGETRVPWTISLGTVAGQTETLTGAQLLEQGERALTLAQHSGGNNVSTYEDVVADDRRWAELAGGRLFAEAVLRNFMVPCPRLLRTSDPLVHAESCLRQTQLPALPVVDEEGKLAGLLTADSRHLRQAAERGLGTVSEIMQREAVSFDEATTLPVLLDYFTQEEPEVVVVVHKGRPTGLVTPASLGTLVEPLTSATFSPLAEVAGHRGLIVPH